MFIVRSRLLVYSAGSVVNRVQVVLSGFSKRVCCFVNVTADINYFRFISLDTIRVLREEVCLPSFDVVNCLLK